MRLSAVTAHAVLLGALFTLPLSGTPAATAAGPGVNSAATLVLTLADVSRLYGRGFTPTSYPIPNSAAAGSGISAQSFTAHGRVGGYETWYERNPADFRGVFLIIARVDVFGTIAGSRWGLAAIRRQGPLTGADGGHYRHIAGLGQSALFTPQQQTSPISRAGQHGFEFIVRQGRYLAVFQVAALGPARLAAALRLARLQVSHLRSAP